MNLWSQYQGNVFLVLMKQSSKIRKAVFVDQGTQFNESRNRLIYHDIRLVVVIYTTAGTHPIQNDYSHGSRFLYQKVYIHGCRASSIKVLFTRQSFLMPKSLYTRLPCIKYKSAIYTAAVSHAKRFLYTAAVQPV